MKKRYILVIALLLFKTVNAQWTALSSGTTATLRGLYFMNASTGFISGDNGLIKKTSNGGNSWTSVNNSGSTYDLGHLHFVDANNGFAMGGSSSGGGDILKTTDGGSNWTVVNTYSNSEVLWCMQFTDANTGYVAGKAGLIKKTSNGGSSWTVLNPGVTKKLKDISFPTPAVGYVVGDSVILKTTDAGSTWQVVSSANDFHTSIYFINANIGFAGYYNSTDAGLLKTTDGGTTWQKVNGYPPQQMTFPSSNIGYAVAYNGLDTSSTILKTIDGGSTWTSQVHYSQRFLTSLSFANDSVGYVVGDNGNLFKTSNGGGVNTTFINAPLQAISTEIMLYPNPNNGIFSVRSSINNTKIEVMNMLGEKIYSGQINVGKKDMDLSQQAKGIYFYQIKSEDKILKTGKMMIE